MSLRQSLAIGAIATIAIAAAARDARAGWKTPAAGPTLSGDPEIVLTFDDGPNPSTTPKVLDTLAAHHAKAVFFLVGDRLVPENRGARELVGRILREGHIIANHTMTHDQLCAISAEKAAAEIDGAAIVITAISGMPAPWFRTPYGAWCTRLENMLVERKLRHFYWDIDSQEWRHNNAKRATAFITRSLGKLQGRAVVLMHDTKLATVKALPQILDWLAAENKKRAESTRRQIHLLNPATVALENVAPGLVDWLAQATTAALDTAGRVATCLP